MLSHNAKGLLTLLLIVALLVALFAGYKSILEPRLNSPVDQFAVEEETRITPEIEISDTNATITWETPYDSAGRVVYATQKEACVNEEGECISVDSTDDQNHSVTLTDLTPNTEYFYKISIDDFSYPLEEEEFYTFTTLVSPEEEERAEANTPDNSEITVDNIKQGIRDQNLEYDLNNDGKVSVADIVELKKVSSEE